MKSNTMMIFTDASISPQTCIGVGVFLCLSREHIEAYDQCSMEELSAKLSNQIVYTEYQSKKSTWSEIKTVIHALNFIQKNSKIDSKIEIYTDCQSLCDLMGRRKEKLKKSHFITKTGKLLQNADLYKELFEIAEKFQIQTVKIKGHNSISNRLTVQEKIFAVLDQCSRKKLRGILNSK